MRCRGMQAGPMTASTPGQLARAAERQPTATAIGPCGRSLRRHRLHSSLSPEYLLCKSNIYIRIDVAGPA